VTPIQILPPRIDRDEAIRRFRRRRSANLFGLWQSRPARLNGNGQPDSLEMVWLPAYGFEFSIDNQGKKVTSWVSIDASFGGFAVMGRVKELVEGSPAEVIFPPMLTEEQADALAREGVIRFILRKRGAKPAVNDITNSMLFHMPAWVYYFRRSGGRLDLAVSDAYTGDPMGVQVRRAIVDGFIARKREEPSDQSS
jgi:hypothetical protein